MKPLFIFSLPRAGSTLLQRLLMAGSGIASAAEPWILLPLIYMERGSGTVSEYSHNSSRYAIEDVVASMRGGRAAYDELLRKFVTGIYEELSPGGAKYFLDKTPRYYLIIPEIARVFPDAKFIFLFRNPADVYASILTTWNDGGFKRIWSHWIDLDEGPSLLSAGYRLLGDKACAVQYEALVSDPKASLRRIYDYLGLDFDEQAVSDFVNHHLKGRMGDSTGVVQFDKVSSQSVDRWKTVFDNRFRKHVLARYIRSLPDEVLSVQGYSKAAILDAVLQNPVCCRHCVADFYFYLRALLVRSAHANMFAGPGMAWARHRHLS